ncbi:hypothetical protein B0A49_07587 [Cryomyces minteri]|uniref:RNA-dependent RNA polymerase n=1 Tax=Cryomyces minteri TaxID=331657 RepID=A0A4U0WPR5_9PEZI|nr:hypothetical protein B0A49_07587 [Cryomyces minteri]
MSREGTIVRIEILDRRVTDVGIHAMVTFCPPPSRAFWDVYSQKFQLMSKRQSKPYPSITNPEQSFPERTRLIADTLGFGFMHNETTIVVRKTVQPMQDKPIQFTLDLFRKEIDIRFDLHLRENSDESNKLRPHAYRVRVPLEQMKYVYEMTDGPDRRILIIPLDSPPNFYRKASNIDATHEAGSKWWNENVTWMRQTDIVHDRDRLRSAPLSLRKEDPLVDIGRWITYWLVFDASKNDKAQYVILLRALSDYNIDIVKGRIINVTTEAAPAVWNWIDQPKVARENSSGSSSFLMDMQMMHDETPQLSFPVRYQLEVCISQGYLNEHDLSQDFIRRLALQEQDAARNLLEKVADMKGRFFDPMEIFSITVTHTSADRKIPNYCAYARGVTVTPSTMYFATPTIETSNRVIRQYSEYGDRFLRVKFTDEKFQGRINSKYDHTYDEVFTRVKRAMTNGITIGEQHFEFLAFGNSQLREHGAYFFASNPYVSAADIRLWMGSFNHIKIVAKYASRLGQCFSTTRAFNGMNVLVREDVDVERNGYCFTDGVGKISPFLAQVIAVEVGLPNPNENPPSLVQFRLGGCKGVLAVSPDAKMREIYIRRSQYKFPAMHQGLEIIRTAAFSTATLNQQIILVLSALGVPDEIFMTKLRKMLVDLEQAISDERMALQLLQKNVDFNQMTLTLATMILDGFMQSGDPFTTALLQLWRAWTIKYLKEKAKIPVEEGAFLLGCVDETATLRGHFDSVEPDVDTENTLRDLPEIFVQVSTPEKKGAYRVVEGVCILARNPSLHPGDVRVVRAVDVPALRHLKNVVVLPQTGDRPIANMCSGGDLDGDDYLVIWDEDLLPVEVNYPAMDFTPPTPVQHEGPVTVDDITSFFVNYMKNDSLPRIATAHRAWADRMDDGVKDPHCTRLAQLHSEAVDYPKSGVAVKMGAELRPLERPHWMQYKGKGKIYHSKKVLGQLYDQVELVDFVPHYSAPFDKRILDAYELDQSVLDHATEVKELYDAAVRRVMAQHDIRTEFEVWSTFVLYHSQDNGDYKFTEDLGRITEALKGRFKELCYQKAGGKEFEKLGPFVAAMYTVTATQTKKPLAECERTKIVGGRELGKIANGKTSGRTESIVTQQHVAKRSHAAKKVPTSLLDADDDVLTEEGVKHRGDILELFHSDENFHDTGNGVSRPLDHVAMVDLGIKGPTYGHHRDSHPQIHPLVTHDEWAPLKEVVELLQDTEDPEEGMYNSLETSAAEETSDGEETSGAYETSGTEDEGLVGLEGENKITPGSPSFSEHTPHNLSPHSAAPVQGTSSCEIPTYEGLPYATPQEANADNSGDSLLSFEDDTVLGSHSSLRQSPQHRYDRGVARVYKDNRDDALTNECPRHENSEDTLFSFDNETVQSNHNENNRLSNPQIVEEVQAPKKISLEHKSMSDGRGQDDSEGEEEEEVQISFDNHPSALEKLMKMVR